MDLTLQLLRKGYPNAVWHTTVNDQRKFAAPGGATNERTIERSNADAHELGLVQKEHLQYISKFIHSVISCNSSRLGTNDGDVDCGKLSIGNFDALRIFILVKFGAHCKARICPCRGN